MYDSHLNENVAVVCHLLFLLADNPRASELVCHLGSSNGTADCAW